MEDVLYDDAMREKEKERDGEQEELEELENDADIGKEDGDIELQFFNQAFLIVIVLAPY